MRAVRVVGVAWGVRIVISVMVWRRDHSGADRYRRQRATCNWLWLLLRKMPLRAI